MSPTKTNGSEFKVRPYQQELFEKVCQKNMIIYLPTGSGKTYIAIKLIQEFSSSIDKPLAEGGKRTVFLANTVPLIIQQAEFLRMHCNQNVGDYYGDRVIDNKKLDFWDKEIWEKELAENQILVVVPQILVDMIQHAFLQLEQINLLIFDECHHATGNHPYSQLLRLYQNHQDAGSIRLLGLTASIVVKKCNLSKFKEEYRKIEDKFCCKIESALINTEGEESSGILFKKPNIKVVAYSSEFLKESIIYKTIQNVNKYLQEMDRQFVDNIKSIASADLPHYDELISNPYKALKKALGDLEVLFAELGVWSFDKAYKATIDYLKTKIPEWKDCHQGERFEKLVLSLDTCFNNLLEDFDCLDTNVLTYSSEKVNALAQIYKYQSQNSVDQNFHSIIFVDRKIVAVYLDMVLKKLSEMPMWTFLRSDFIFSVGTNGQNTKVVNTFRSTIRSKDPLQKFRQNQLNILISTNLIEEGVDIPSCNMIIRFSKPPNFGSYTQSKGRARSLNSVYYLLADTCNMSDFLEELENFIEIENDIERQFLQKTVNDSDYDTVNDIHQLNKLIAPYKKGNAEITCHTAINIVSRYCSNLEQIDCSCIYPVYQIEETAIEGTKTNMLYRCKLWLPPNPVLNKEIQSRYFARKRWAKMDAALSMCKELDQAGQLAENLTVLTRDQWIKPHCNLNNSEQKPIKNKNSYKTEIADDFLNNHVKPDQDSYIYNINITGSNRSAVKGVHIGYLSSKNFSDVPAFKLYQSKLNYVVSISQISKSIQLKKDEYELLVAINKLLFNSLLQLRLEFDFEKSDYGGFIVFLIKSESDGFTIDWDFMKSIKIEKHSVLDLIKNQELSKLDLNKFLVRLDINPEIIQTDKAMRHQSERLFQVKGIDPGMTPLSDFVKANSECFNFKEHFTANYNLKTVDNSQPMVEIDELKPNMNFIINEQDAGVAKKELSYRMMFIAEHLIVVPFQPSWLKVLCMIPAIFHRANFLKKAEQLKNIIQTSIFKKLEIKNIVDSTDQSWDDSLSFSKEANKCGTPDIDGFNKSDKNTMLIEPSAQDIMANMKNYMEAQDLKGEHPELPELLITESTKMDKNNMSMPNVYHIAQCLTTRASQDNFDLERYELIGDSFLKLVVVMKIYLQFTQTNEGNMAELKSQRVSNKYLTQLAMDKQLYKYINVQNFQPRLNWIAPNMKRPDKVKDDENPFEFKTINKTLADCVEALIGGYLIHSGTSSAKAFIEWLDFRISDKEGIAEFVNSERELPSPILSKQSINFSQWIHFSKQVLHYEFKEIAYLYQAFTHPSFTKNRLTSSYQKLELVGDAVIDFLITQYIFQDKKEFSPGELTLLRSSLVNNKFFAHLSVKNNFHKYFNYESKEIFNIISDYLKVWQANSPDMAYFNIQNNFNDSYLEMDTPKFLADLFESVAGAIYLDSGCSLETVWKVYYPFLAPYLKQFRDNPPVSPISALEKLRRPGEAISFETETVEDEVIGKLTVGSCVFHSRSASKNNAKLIAYTKAIRHLDKNKSIILI